MFPLFANKGNIKYNLSAEPIGEAQPSHYLHFICGFLTNTSGYY